MEEAMIMICEICQERIGELSLEGRTGVKDLPDIAPLRYPITGAMVGSPDPFHQVPAPFDASLTWEFLRCPYGRIHRPMVKEDEVLTHKGLLVLPKDGSMPFHVESKPGIDRHSIGDRVSCNFT